MRLLISILFVSLISGCAGFDIRQDNGKDRFTLHFATYSLKGDAINYAFRLCTSRGYSRVLLTDKYDGFYNHSATYLCQNPEVQTPATPRFIPTPTSNNVSLEDAKSKCRDLGFKAGTEAYGNCVLKLSK